jgi:hypothetical protein
MEVSSLQGGIVTSMTCEKREVTFTRETNKDGKPLNHLGWD